MTKFFKTIFRSAFYIFDIENHLLRLKNIIMYSNVIIRNYRKWFLEICSMFIYVDQIITIIHFFSRELKKCNYNFQKYFFRNKIRDIGSIFIYVNQTMTVIVFSRIKMSLNFSKEHRKTLIRVELYFKYKRLKYLQIVLEHFS